MSLKRKDPSAPGGLRVAANDPHLVSLGGGRLSTAVTIHYIPIGTMTIGSSPECSISLNGSGVQNLHCTLYRNENVEVTIIPEKDARVLIDGNKITSGTNLTQGAMLTIGNSNYLRFNNPAEAQMIKSTMGSNERISMPQIDFTQDHRQSDSSSCNSTSSKGGLLNNALKSLTKSYDNHLNQNKTNNETILEKVAKVEYINVNNFHSPKVFTADSITVNAPAKDVLGPKYANFAKNLATNHKNDKNFCIKNNEMNFNNNKSGNYVNIPPPANFIQNTSSSSIGFAASSSSTSTSSSNLYNNPITNNEVLTKVNNNNAVCNCIQSSPQRNQMMISAAYDRYPKIGGGLQVFPMNGVNSEINYGERSNFYENEQQQKSKTITAQEQERLDEILKICTEYEKQQQQQQQNQYNNGSSSVQSSPIVQNRIKTNGSLPRDKKSPFFDMNSQTPNSVHSKTFFPAPITAAAASSSPSIAIGTKSVDASEQQKPKTTSTTATNPGYENVRIIGDRRIEIGSPSLHHHHHHKNSSGYENVIIGKYIPQSPRTKIRTTCTSPQKKDISHLTPCPTSPPPSTTQSNRNHYNYHCNHNTSNSSSQSTTEYAHLIQTFEEKLKMEMEAIQECTKVREKQQTVPSSSPIPILNSTVTNNTSIINGNDSLRKRQNLNINNLTLNLNPNTSSNSDNSNSLIKDIEASEGEEGNLIMQELNNETTKHIDNLKKDRENVLAKIRKLKTQIAEIQRQEDEVLRELDLEKALVSAEMSTVNVSLVEMEKSFKSLQSKIHRLEAQRNANRVMQETQQAKLKQSIEMKQEQVAALQKMLRENELDESLKEELEKNMESLENDRKLFEDLEFQYLEEEADWMAYRDELHNDLKNLTKDIEEKQLQMIHLQTQGIENQNSACTDTKTLENNLLTLLKELEKSREELQSIDKTIYETSGDYSVQHQQNNHSNSDDDDEDDDEIGLRKKTTTTTTNMKNGLNLNTIMSQSLFGSTEILTTASKSKETANLMSRSVNENMFFNNKIEMPSANTTTMNAGMVAVDGPSTSTPRKELTLFEIKTDDDDFNLNSNQSTQNNDEKVNTEITPEIVRREHNNDEKDPILKLKYNVKVQNSHNNSNCSNNINNNNNNETNHKVSNLNLSLESDDFEVNPLDKRIPSQDDIDRICKITLDAPISTTKGASSKIIESIKEIERNRQLLLAQQGSHVIEHERQKMMELKKRCHDEARAQYLSSQNIAQQCNSDNKAKSENVSNDKQKSENAIEENTTLIKKSDNSQGVQQQESEQKTSQQRHSHPELESQRSRPLSDVNSDINYEKLKDKHFKSNNDLTASTVAIAATSSSPTSTGNRYSDNSDDGKRSSLNSNNTLDDDNRSISTTNCNNSISNYNKRTLPKHQRPLTRYLPIMSPDLDLRQHIESAGHQISLCPHVIIDSYSCRGYLHKLGATFHGWSRRWFVLDRKKNAFIYYSDRSERKPRGGAYFSTIDEVYLDHLNTSKSGRPHCTFIVKTKRRSYHLQAASDAAARIWIDAIITGAQGNIDY